MILVVLLVVIKSPECSSETCPDPTRQCFRWVVDAQLHIFVAFSNWRRLHVSEVKHMLKKPKTDVK